MKKKLLIVAGLVILALLIFQFFTEHVDGVHHEREWYVAQLGYQFSAKVDTVNASGIVITLTDADIFREKEEVLNQKLKFNGVLDLFLYQPDGKLSLLMEGSARFHQGDSIYISCPENIVKVYRGDKLMVERPLVKSLRGRPF
jgi:hypothetical protein